MCGTARQAATNYKLSWTAAAGVPSERGFARNGVEVPSDVLDVSPHLLFHNDHG